jgi:hypothetical protein
MHIVRATCLAMAVLLAMPGCSWFRAKPAPEGEAPAETAVGPATEAMPAASAASAPAATPAADAGEPAQGPVAVAMDILVMHQRLGNSGLPQRADMAAYDAFLCPDLAQAIRAAQVRQEVARAERPDEKPPYVEGDLFSSLFEGPERFEVSDSQVDGDLARVRVAMRHGEGETAKRWTDTLVMRLDDGIWCLADVEYGGEWPMANKGRLGSALQAP